MIDSAALAEVGYTTTRLLTADEVAGLRREHDRLAVDPTTPYWVSNIQGDRSVARSVDRRLRQVLGPACLEALPQHRPFLAALIVKGAGGGRVGLHPDWTYTDERTARARLFWCPLVDTDEGNGALRVIPGSHRVVRGLRGSGAFPSPVEGIEDELTDRAAVTVPLEAGEAIVYDPAVIHGSGGNHTAAPRPAAAIAVAPTGASLVHFHLDPGGPVEGYEVDDAWFVDAFGTRPVGYPAIDAWDDPVRRLALDELVTGSARP